MIGKLVAFVINIFRFHKLKVLAVILSAAIFSVFIFPYDDLSEVVTNLVSERTGNRAFVQFDSLGLQLFPYPALAVQNALVESSMGPTVKATSISVIPSIMGLLTLNPGVHATAKGVWGGNVGLDFKMGKKSEQGGPINSVGFELENIDIAKSTESLNLPMQLQGQLSGEANSKIDFTMTNQPEGEVQLRLADLRFPAFTLPIPVPGVPGEPMATMGLDLPGLSWSTTQIKGHLSSNKLQLEEFSLGTERDPLNASIRGEVALQFRSDEGGAISPVVGTYSLEVDLNVNASAEKQLPFIGFLSSFKQPGGGLVSKYRFALNGSGMGTPPRIGPVSR